VLNAGSEAWQPTTFKRWVESIPTSTGPAIIVTDAGQALIKALGNKEGPHALACEWIGTKLAAWLGLATYDIAIMKVTEDDEIPLGHGRRAKAGPAIVIRWEKGETWSNVPGQLEQTSNHENTIPGIVVLDTWLRNPDRYPPPGTHWKPRPDNVFLSVEKGSADPPVLKAIDHSACLAWGKDLTEALAHIHTVRDDRLYGLFPLFRPFVTRISIRPWLLRLAVFDQHLGASLVDTIPTEWNLTTKVRRAIVELLSRRASYVADTIEDSIGQTMMSETGQLWL